MKKSLIYLALIWTVLAVNANAITKVDGCYQIGSKDELKGFASLVNSTSNPEKNACAVLTADITINTSLVKSDLSDCNWKWSYESWSPLQNFSGTIDGQGHTISGLYNDGSLLGYHYGSNVAFIGSAEDGAVLKNLRIDDSYFSAQTAGGGLIGSVIGGSVTIDNCSFRGVVKYNGVEAKSLGGLVGTVENGASLILTNSYNEGNVRSDRSVWSGSDGGVGVDLGGLVGSIDGSAVIKDCYSTGDVSVKKENGSTYNPLVGEVSDPNNLVAQNVGCVTSNKCDDVVPKSAVVQNKDPQELANTVNDTAATNMGKGLVGISIEYKSSLKKIIATIHDTALVLTIPEDITVDSVYYDRAYTKDQKSTCVLPFTTAARNIGGARFYKPKQMNVTEDNKWEVGVDTVKNGNVEAHTPYIIEPSQDGVLSISGPVTLKAVDGTAGSTSFDGWALKGVYTDKTWTSEQNVDEFGRVYGYRSSDGVFVKAGKKGHAGVFRAYLLAPMSSSSSSRPMFKTADDSTVAVAADSSAEDSTAVDTEVVDSAKIDSSMADTAAIDSAKADLPSQILMRVLGSDEKEFPIVNVEVEIDESLFEIVELPEPEMDDMDSAETTAIQKWRGTSSDVRKNQWRDIKGRRMIRKPSAKGVYLENAVPVMVR